VNKTNPYQLNQWEPTDRILREDFNRDNVNLENALVGLGAAVTAEAAARAEAVAAAKNEANAAVSAEANARASAINSAVSQINGTIGQINNTKANQTALNAVSARVDAMPFVKLKSITTSAAAAQVNVDVSDIRLSDYAYWLIVPALSAGSSMIGLRFNDYTVNYIYNGNSGGYIAQFSGAVDITPNGGTAAELKLMTYGTNHHIMCLGAYNQYGKHTAVAGYIPNIRMSAATLTTLNFVSITSGTNIAAGGKISIYGVKW